MTLQEQTYIPKNCILQAISSQFKENLKLLLIGTHKDLLGESEENRQEEFKTVETTLFNLLESSKEFKDSQHFQDFFVGIGFQTKDLQSTEMQSKIIEQQDISQVKKKLIAMIQPADNQVIPAPWLVFSFILHKYATSKELGKLQIEIWPRNVASKMTILIVLLSFFITMQAQCYIIHIFMSLRTLFLLTFSQ